MKIQIKNRFNETVLFETDAESLGGAVRAAITARANLYGAYLKGAYLKGANLEGTYLKGTYLKGANLEGANLEGANLYGANLEGANLYGAKVPDADLTKIISTRGILPDGDLIGWKKLRDGVICKLKIPAEARRIGGVIGRKCRAEYAVVLSGAGTSQHDSNFKYVVRKKVKPAQPFDPNPLVECASGIHFFINKAEAEAY